MDLLAEQSRRCPGKRDGCRRARPVYRVSSAHPPGPAPRPAKVRTRFLSAKSTLQEAPILAPDSAIVPAQAIVGADSHYHAGRAVAGEVLRLLRAGQADGRRT